MKQQSAKKNLILQGLYQFLMLGIPLVISPYLTRTLGAEKLGMYTYVNSIAYYFVILANLGISRHGQRVIAATSADSPMKLRKTFYSLFAVHFCISAVSFIAYFVFIQLFITENKAIFYIEALYVVSALFDITWFYYGVENFRSVVIKNTVIKLIELGCVFAFVHNQSDLEAYTFIMAGSLLLGQAIMIPQAIKNVRPAQITFNDCLIHIKPLVMLSISVVAVTLYTVFDKTLLGIMLNMESVSYYDCANRIIGVPKVLLGVVTTALFPRACRLAEEKKEDELQQIFYTSFMVTAVLGIGFISCVVAVAESFAPLYYGAGFEKTGEVMIVMAPVILIVALGDVIRTQLMISQKRDGSYIFCVVMNAIVNIVLSVLLIPLIGIYGAVIGSIAAEMCGLVLETCFCKESIDFKQTYGQIPPFIIIGIVTVALARTVLQTELRTFYVTLLQGMVVGCSYAVLSIVYLVCFKKDIITRILRVFRI